MMMTRNKTDLIDSWFITRNYPSFCIVQSIDCFMEHRRTNKINRKHNLYVRNRNLGLVWKQFVYTYCCRLRLAIIFIIIVESKYLCLFTRDNWCFFGLVSTAARHLLPLVPWGLNNTATTRRFHTRSKFTLRILIFAPSVLVTSATSL